MNGERFDCANAYAVNQPTVNLLTSLACDRINGRAFEGTAHNVRTVWPN
jgi:hypothetical protein